MSQDFGGNKYSKNSMIMYIINDKLWYIYTNENRINHNPNWPYIPDHPYRILIIAGSGSGKTNALLNLIHNQPDIDKIYLYAKDPYDDKYQYLINKRESIGISHLSDPKAFIEYSNNMHDFYQNIDNYNHDKYLFSGMQFYRKKDNINIYKHIIINIYKKCTDKPYSFPVLFCKQCLSFLLTLIKKTNY